MIKQSDLTPPLGWMGGPCKVVERIEDTVRTPALREELSEKVEHGQKLTNPEAAKVYTLEAERGGGLFTKIRITPHAQYRMDQRAITVGDLRAFFMDFSKKLNDWKSQRAPEFNQYTEALSRGGPVDWVDKRLGDLMVVFVSSGRGVVDIVTTYWEGEPDPRPDTCGTHPRHDHKSAREVEDMSGARTFVKNPSPSKSDTDKSQGDAGKYPTQGLPAPWSRSKPTKGPTVLNVPGESGSNSDGTVHEDKVRTKGVPGEQTSIPDGPARIGPTRRPGMTAEVMQPDIFEGMDPAMISTVVRLAGMYPPAYPTGQTRHHKQRGQAYRYFHKRYRQHRGEIIRRQKRRHKRLRGRGTYTKDRQRRKKSPERFETKPSGGARTIAERSKKQRDKAKKAAVSTIPFYYYSTGVWGSILEVSPLGKVHYEVSGRRHTADLDTFLDAIVVDDDRLDEFMAYLDDVFEYEDDVQDESPGLDTDDEDTSFDAWLMKNPEYASDKLARAVLADFLREQRPPDMTPDTTYDRANNHDEWKRRKRMPLEDISEYSGDNAGNPGSKVLPSGAGHVEKEAAFIQDIRQGCAPDLETKARVLKVGLRRVDAQNALWLFDVEGSKEPYRVRLQAVRKGNVKALAKAHVKVSCTCPFWQWQGPEHWASQGDYLYGRPVGSATQPKVKDPSGQHRACKHVLAMFRFVMDRKWDLPELRTKQGALQFLADTLAQSNLLRTETSKFDQALRRVAARYLVSRRY